MCGRYELHTQPAAIALAFGLPFPPEITPRYNIAPTQPVPIVRLRDGVRELAQVRWGLVPWWAKDLSFGAKCINARAETAATAPAFRDAYRQKRCLIPASGYYQWQQMGGKKRPVYVRRTDGNVFAFAGLWSRWPPKDGEGVESCTIITTEAAEGLADLHNRMPAILEQEDIARWLDLEDPEPEALLKSCAGDLTIYPVSSRVGSPKNDDAGLIDPAPDEPTDTLSLFNPGRAIEHKR